MDERKKSWVIIGVIVAVIVLIVILNNLNANGKINESEIKCIAGKSKLYISRTCGHCANQKEILGEYLDYFDVTDCVSDQQGCIDAEIKGVPTWIISSEKYTGTKSLKDLKQLAGC